MLVSLRSWSARMLVVCAVVFVAASMTPSVALRSEEQKSCTLFFALPEGTVLHYENFAQTNQNFRGSDVTFNQTSDVDMSYAGKSEDNNCKIELKFNKVKSSLLNNGQLQSWEPPIKLEGSSIRVTVSRTAEVLKVDPGTNLVGVRNLKDLRDLIETWFIRLPDTTVTVGQTWKREIVEGKREGAEPEIKGEAVYTLKKIEKRGNLDVASIEGKTNLKMNSDTPAGVLVADGTVNVKAVVAVAGGYIVELKEDLDIKGNTIEKDPLTDKETKQKTAVTRHYEIKLK